MISDRANELIHKQLDALITPDEQKELQHLLDSQPDVRACYDGMKETFSILESVSDEVEPPHNLRERIISALPREQSQHFVQKDPFSLADFLASVFSKQVMIFGLGAAAGIALFLVGSFLWNSGGSIEHNQIYGTINIARSAGGNSPSTDVRFDNDQYHATVSLKLTDASINAHINVQTREQSTLVFEYDRTQLAVNGFHRVSGDFNTVSMGNDASITMGVGNHDCHMEFERKQTHNATLFVKLFTGSALIFERRIVVDGKL